jgi:hypothetical protein
MTTKAEFNAEEWDTIVDGPAIAGMIVVMAQRGGTVRETLEISKVYAEARKEHADDGLIDEIVSSPPSVQASEFGSAEELRSKGIQKIRDGVALLESKGSPDDVDAYRGFALRVAERAAARNKSGGTLGIGGERVSEAESAALDEVAAALGTERAGGPPTES